LKNFQEIYAAVSVKGLVRKSVLRAASLCFAGALPACASWLPALRGRRRRTAWWRAMAKAVAMLYRGAQASASVRQQQKQRCARKVCVPQRYVYSLQRYVNHSKYIVESHSKYIESHSKYIVESHSKYIVESQQIYCK
jgi:hypothetical protein